jgi:hypothetical protein
LKVLENYHKQQELQKILENNLKELNEKCQEDLDELIGKRKINIESLVQNAAIQNGKRK